MNIPVFDLHCDTALALLGKDAAAVGSLKTNAGHLDLDRAGELAGFAQCFACFTTPEMEKWYHKSPVEMFERELVAILSQIESNSGRIALAYSAKDVRGNQAAGKMSAILTIEGSAGFGYDPELLPDLHSVGFRIASLGWNEKNPLTGSNKTGGGLTDQGREFVRIAQKLGMVIDVSHISDEGFWDIMDITEKPVVATHSNRQMICSRLSAKPAAWQDLISARTLLQRHRIWTQPVIISCIFWSLTLRVTISPSVVTWTGVMTSRQDLRACRAIPSLQTVF